MSASGTKRKSKVYRSMSACGGTADIVQTLRLKAVAAGRLNCRNFRNSKKVSEWLGRAESPSPRLPFSIDIHSIDAHGDIPTRQRKAAALQKTR
jgi:hypothetical protein